MLLNASKIVAAYRLMKNLFGRQSRDGTNRHGSKGCIAFHPCLSHTFQDPFEWNQKWVETLHPLIVPASYIDVLLLPSPS